MRICRKVMMGMSRGAAPGGKAKILGNTGDWEGERGASRPEGCSPKVEQFHRQVPHKLILNI